MRNSSFMRIMKLFQGFKKQFVVIPDYIITSARRYQQMGFGLQYHFSIIHLKRRLGHSVKACCII
jgi:hypothetical protein